MLNWSLIDSKDCSGAHFLGRALHKQGHDVGLIPARFVKPFVKSNKNDFIDAEAIAEAVERKNMRFVPSPMFLYGLPKGQRLSLERLQPHPPPRRRVGFCKLANLHLASLA